MLAQLNNLFVANSIAQALNTLPPVETTIMDSYFKSRPSHPMSIIGLQEVCDVVQTVPVVRRDGNPVSLGTEKAEMNFIAPLPIKVKVNVSASDLNDLRTLFGNTQAVEAWRNRKVEQMRNAIRNTTEGMCSVVLATGALTWPIWLDGGVKENYSVDYGDILSYTSETLLSGSSKLSDIYALLRKMEEKIKKSGIGGNVEFLAGSDVVAILLDIVEAHTSTAEGSPYKLELGKGYIQVGSYVIKFMDEVYPDPNNIQGEWINKIPAKALFCVSTNAIGSVWYCAIDSISANNAAMPLHIVPVKKDDDSGITLIANAKPLPARSSKGVCKAIVVE